MLSVKSASFDIRDSDTGRNFRVDLSLTKDRIEVRDVSAATGMVDRLGQGFVSSHQAMNAVRRFLQLETNGG